MSGVCRVRRARGERGKGGDALGRWSRHWARPGRRGRRPRRGSSRPRRQARRSGAPLPAWRAGWRRARHAGSAPASRPWPRGGQARRAEAHRALRARRRRWRAALSSRRSTGKDGSLVEVTWLKGRRRSARRRQAVETPERGRSVRRGRARRENSLRARKLSIAGSGASISRSNTAISAAFIPSSVVFGEAAEQEIHLLRAAMRRPPQRPAAAHAKIVAGHDNAFLCRSAWVRASAPSLSRTWRTRPVH